MKKRNYLTLFVLLLTFIVALVTLNGDKIMKVVWEFRDGFVGVPRR